ncbi:lipid II flippase Amj family protein [Chitinophagaceae bacterium LB-8]|uniref:Lipid II flippase Amj family protein n=1 Tax=Paraflavisolibacter caeni TaxID=2982496 RepID=A0A9X3BJL0_9BACT|nr:DUF2837 family protein [Paraflavisolibacter caeni]MCU7551348.1 lipid II flippase Amj family protein [Paraflavisolibacter caeni]
MVETPEMVGSKVLVLSAMTDDVMLGNCSEATFRKYIVYMTLARLLGTLLAQLIFLPSADLLAFIATMM